MGNLTGAIETKQDYIGDERLVSLVQVQPYHAYFTTRRLVFFSMGSLKKTGECAATNEDTRILLGDKIHSKQNIFYYVTSDGKIIFAGLRNSACQVLSKIDVLPALHNPRAVQLGFRLLLWPDGSLNSFISYDLKFAVSGKNSIPSFNDLSFEGLSKDDMSSLDRISVHKYSPEEKYYISLMINNNRLVVKRLNILKPPKDAQEDSSGFKPPLFLIGIGIALLYQVLDNYPRYSSDLKANRLLCLALRRKEAYLRTSTISIRSGKS